MPLWLISHPAFSTIHFPDFVTSETDLEALGHTQNSKPLLKFLADHFKYPEAILTLGKSYFTDSDESSAKFAEFVERHRDNQWLLESLAYVEPSSVEKYKSYTAAMAAHSGLLDKVIEIRRSLERQRNAAKASSEFEIRELFEGGDPAVLRVLSANKHTPTDLLQKMLSLQGVKFARDIRNQAQNLLRQREKN